jgi:hypothetical protein
MMEPLRTVLTSVARELLRVAHWEYDLYFRGFLHNHLCHGIVSLTAIAATTTISSSSSSSSAVSDEEIKAHYSEQMKMYEKRRNREPTEDEDDSINAIITTEN